jgi:uncharacterized protein YjbK
MQQNLEIEVKALVNKDQFSNICNYFKVNKHNFKIQTNYYFDTREQVILKKYHSALRIRQVDNQFLLTFKVKQANGINEFEHQIDEATLNALVNKQITLQGYFDDIFQKMQVKYEDVIFLTSLKTQRLSLPYLQGELFLDINYYNSSIDYEIEYETFSYEYGIEVLTKLFHELGYEFIQNHVSKRERATKKE